MWLQSPRAGGRYFNYGSAAAIPESRGERVKARLTSWLVDQRRSGTRRPEVMTGLVDDAVGYRDLTARQPVDRLLGFIAARSSRIEATFPFANQYITRAATTWRESTNMEEVRFLPGCIEKRGRLVADGLARARYVVKINEDARLADLADGDTSERFQESRDGGAGSVTGVRSAALPAGRRPDGRLTGLPAARIGGVGPRLTALGQLQAPDARRSWKTRRWKL